MTIIYRYREYFRLFHFTQSDFTDFNFSDVFSVLIWLRLIASFQSVMPLRILRLRWLRAPLRWNWQRGKFENDSNTQPRGCGICYCPSLRRYFHRNLCKVNKRKVITQLQNGFTVAVCVDLPQDFPFPLDHVNSTAIPANTVKQNVCHLG